MVSSFNASDEDVSYEFEEFIYLQSDVAGPVGFNWSLELPITNPDPTVRITDGDTTYEFTEVELVPDDANTSVADPELRAVARTEV